MALSADIEVVCGVGAEVAGAQMQEGVGDGRMGGHPNGEVGNNGVADNDIVATEIVGGGCGPGEQCAVGAEAEQ